MPRYDYKCADCQTEFELRQSFAEAGSGVCPSCSGIGRRVFHAVPVIYKGTVDTDGKMTGTIDIGGGLETGIWPFTARRPDA